MDLLKSTLGALLIISVSKGRVERSTTVPRELPDSPSAHDLGFLVISTSTSISRLTVVCS